MSNKPSQFDIELAAVCGTTAKNNDKLAAYRAWAKAFLDLTSTTADNRFLIIQYNATEIQRLIETGLNDKEAKALHWKNVDKWHKAFKANKKQPSSSDNNQLDIETIAPAIPLHTDNAPVINEPIETAPAHIEQVETIPPAVVESIADDNAPALSEVETAAVNEAVALINAPLSELELLRIENAKLQAQLDAVSHKAAPTYDEQETVRISFYALGKRQGVWLKGYLVNSLMLAAGIDKKGVPAWLGNRSFDANDKNITEQVKLLIVRELESQLIKARG